MPNEATMPAARPLAPIQELLADELADILVNGGHRKITDALLRTAYRHYQWRWAVNVYGAENTEKIEAIMKEPLVDKRFDSWRDDLLVAWRETRKTPPPEQPIATASQRVRNSWIERLGHQFDIFLSDGTPEEIVLLWDTLTTHESRTRGRSNFDELTLAEAFEDVLANNINGFLRVPNEMREAVLDYIHWLEEGHLDDGRPYTSAEI